MPVGGFQTCCKMSSIEFVSMEGKRFLVIGGTQFMGRLVVEHLVAAGADVTVLNRGRTPSPFVDNPRVRHVVCDRLNQRKLFREIISSGFDDLSTSGSKRKVRDCEDDVIPWDGVVDFVCFRKRNMHDIITSMKTRHYIFISSDSVYMACDPKKIREYSKVEGGRLLESHIFEPENARILKSQHQYQYQYGNGKLQCEQVLLSSQDVFKQFTILRFPDVIGPFDNLGGHLEIQQAVTNGQAIGLAIAGHDAAAHGPYQLSWLFAPDVPNVVAAVFNAGERVFGEVINVAGDEAPTFEHYLHLVRAAVPDPPPLRLDPHQPAPWVSVCIGPISNGRAKRILGWTPTPLDRAVQETVAWNLKEEHQAYTRRLADSSSSSSSPPPSPSP